MNTILLAIRKPGQLTCTWVPTGDPRAPLVCIWKEADHFAARRGLGHPQPAVQIM